MASLTANRLNNQGCGAFKVQAHQGVSASVLLSASFLSLSM